MVSKLLHGQGVCWRFEEAFQVVKLGKVDSKAFWMGREGLTVILATDRFEFKNKTYSSSFKH